MQFYLYDDALLHSLHEYVYVGMKKGDICIVVATQPHLKSLEDRLIKNGLDTVEARATGQYATFNAAELLSDISRQGPERELFMDHVGSVVQQASESGKPVRVFGEMVGLLWKQNDSEGVMRLEGFWNELSRQYQFSLYCAYPEIYFDRVVHQGVIDRITSCHQAVMV